MHTIRIDVSDTLYDKVMVYLKNLPQKDIKLYDTPKKEENDLVDFFKNSPLHNISFEREEEVYKSKVNF
ncbi:MAG: Unknown protein [uncultured Sulfurovum sp.]|uniref:Uncharacterized protein n=1 Tax=uncultured Sulfurovum sp. TaxID=269237 RepID=A0A6S6U4X0_9BACT|nr:MAG: Unknown protein [uncultured Sulfurovum sp.]